MAMPCRCLVPVFCLLQVVAVVSGGLAPKGHTLLIRCNRQICDLRTHYCDKSHNPDRCSLCADHCRPSRINGNQPATEECTKNCAWYYLSVITPASSRLIATSSMPEIDDWAVNGKKTFAFLVASLLIALCIILLLVIAFVVNFCVRSFTNHQSESRGGVCMDASSHCRNVDDSKLLTRNRTMTPRDLEAAVSTACDTTCPKVPDHQPSLTTNTSLEPLLRQQPDVGNRVL